MKLLIFAVLFLNAAALPDGRRSKRQLSIDDIIQRALSLVRPIFDTSQPLQNDAMINRQLNEPSSAEGMRQKSVLGAQQRSILQDLPLCKGNSGLCQFISCQADNFKKDQNFANLNLAAQVLGDKKLRKAVSSSPDAINAVCDEQGMSEDQCRLFSKGFQLIDKFITTVEGPDAPPGDEQHQAEQKPAPSTNQPMMDDAFHQEEPSYDSDENSAKQSVVMADPVPITRTNSRAFGSKTWSALPETLPQRGENQERNDLVASFTPLPSFFGPPGHFIHPTVPTAPPLAFPTFPTMPPFDMQGILSIQPLKMPGLTIEKPIIQFSKDEYAYYYSRNGGSNELRRIKREAGDEDTVDVERDTPQRFKRDYYDDLHQAKRNLGFGQSRRQQITGEKANHSGDDDYYTQTSADDPPANPSSNTRDNSGMRDCLAYLG